MGPDRHRLVADGVQQMCFTETDAAVDIERVVLLSRMLSHRLGSGMDENIRFADHIRFEDLARIEIVVGGRQGCGWSERELLIVRSLIAAIARVSSSATRSPARGGCVAVRELR